MQIVMSSLGCVPVEAGTNTQPSPNVTETTPLGLLWQQLIGVSRPWGQWVIMGCLKWRERFHHLAMRYTCLFICPGGSSD